MIIFRTEISNLVKNSSYTQGEIIDQLDGVNIYFNGKVSNVDGRNTDNKYNLGLKWQCVEFVKRYYFKYYKHKMPNSYGHAKDFFDNKVKDGALNKDRNLIQYSNPSKSKPRKGEIIIFKATSWNRFEHLAIVSEVNDDFIEITQQNPGYFGSSRKKLKIVNHNKEYLINHKSVIGRLRKK